jgi:hypothetical protein
LVTRAKNAGFRKYHPGTKDFYQRKTSLEFFFEIVKYATGEIYYSLFHEIRLAVQY